MKKKHEVPKRMTIYTSNDFCDMAEQLRSKMGLSSQSDVWNLALERLYNSEYNKVEAVVQVKVDGFDSNNPEHVQAVMDAIVKDRRRDDENPGSFAGTLF